MLPLGWSRACFLSFAFALFASSLLPASSEPSQAQPPVPQASPQHAPSPSPGDDSDLAYKIGPGDILKVFVWKEPELSGELQVRFDGKVTVPLLGDVEASARTPEQLAGEVAKAFRKFL